MTQTSEFDAIVVGSGPAGATVARELSRAGRRVLILERGGNAPLAEGFGMATILNTVAVSNELATVRAFTTGGTTAVYFAVAEMPPLDVYRALGLDLSAALDSARKDVPVAVVPESLLSPAALRIRDSAEALGHPCHRSEMLVDLAKCANGYRYEAKWNARMFVHDALQHGATLVNRARVVRVLRDNGRATGVEYRLQVGKKQFEDRTAQAPVVIVAAGGAATPILLRDSGMHGMGADGFHCDPSFVLAGTIRGLKAGENFVGSLGTVVDGDINIGDGNAARVFYRMLMLSNRQWLRAFRHSSSIATGVMIHEEPGGALQSDGRYAKSLGPRDLRKLARGEEVARQILDEAGAKNVIKLKPSASHIGGTVVIGKHVDRNLESECRGLYVCDGSVIPPAARVAPTLTLISLGKYLAGHLTGAV